MNYYSKYIKYKAKYINIKKIFDNVNNDKQYNQYGGTIINIRIKQNDIIKTQQKDIQIVENTNDKIIDFINNIIIKEFPELNIKDLDLFGISIIDNNKTINLSKDDCIITSMRHYYNISTITIHYKLIEKDIKTINEKNNNILHTFISQIILSDYKTYDKQKMYLIIPYSANISNGDNDPDIEKNVLQGLDINAIKYAQNKNICLTLILLDIAFINKSDHIPQTSDYLSMNKTEISTSTDYFNCTKYILNTELNNDSIRTQKYKNYHDYLDKKLGPNWYDILLGINLVIYTIGINFNDFFDPFLANKGLDNYDLYNNIFSNNFFKYHKQHDIDTYLYPIIALKSFGETIIYR